MDEVNPIEELDYAYKEMNKVYRTAKTNGECIGQERECVEFFIDYWPAIKKILRTNEALIKRIHALTERQKGST